MKLPQNDIVIIPREKITDYILSETHATVKFKGKLFRGFGFSERNISLFERALLKIVRSQEVKETLISPYGTKYIIDGNIKTPVGKTIKVRTIWIIEEGQKRPRFVTIYPV